MWNEANTAEFVRLHAEGLSFSAIGSQIGCSRNAAIGKAHRMGLEKRPPTRSERPKRERIRRQRFREVPPMRIGENRLYPVLPLPKPLPDIAASAPTSHSCTLMDLGPLTCRWPLWSDAEPTQLFCGVVPVNGLAYCEHHCRRAYQRRSA